MGDMCAFALEYIGVLIGNNINKLLNFSIILSHMYFSSLILILLTLLNRVKSMKKLLNNEPENFEMAKNVLKQSSKTFLIFNETITLFNQCFWLCLIVKFCEIGFSCTFLFFGIYNILSNDLSIQTIVFFLTEVVHTMIVASVNLPIIIVSNLIKSEVRTFISSFKLYQVKAFENFKILLDSEIPECDITISCGMFDVDWKFLFLCLVAFFSNTIVLIQFDMSF